MLRWIPIVGRMSIRDYFRLILAFAILITEPFFRFLFWVWPAGWSKKRYSQQKLKCNTSDLVEAFGYKCEDHFVQTKDGYILGVQRITAPAGTAGDNRQVNTCLFI